MSVRKRIPTPISQRWRRFRYGVMPWVVFLALMAVVLQMWKDQLGQPQVTGEVEAVRVDVTAPIDGLIDEAKSPRHAMFDRVVKGGVLYRLDSSGIDSNLKISRIQLKELELQIEKTEAETTFEHSVHGQSSAKELTRLTWEVERRKIAYLNRLITLATAKIDLQRFEDQLRILAPLRDKKFVEEFEYIEVQRGRERVLQLIERSQTALAEELKQGREAQALRNQHSTVTPVELDKLVAPIKEAIKAQQIRIQQAQARLDKLEIKSPINGMIVAVHLLPGQSVRAGEPVVTIAKESGSYVISYIREQQMLSPQPGDVVYLRSREPGSVQMTSSVLEVGPQVEPVPQHQLQTSARPEWGLPIKIGLPQEFRARPGELVDISFPPDWVLQQRKRSATNESPSSNANPTKENESPTDSGPVGETARRDDEPDRT